METTAPLARDHQIILHALEVLRLMSERMETDHVVDKGDVGFVLGFFRDVAHQCLDNTEKLLLRPALAKAGTGQNASRLGTTLTHHNQVQTLFMELFGAHESKSDAEFVFFARMYTNFFADLIFEEDRFLPTLVRSTFTDQADREQLAVFEKIEHEIGQRARQQGEALHRLEAKYLTSHCI